MSYNIVLLCVVSWLLIWYNEKGYCNPVWMCLYNIILSKERRLFDMATISADKILTIDGWKTIQVNLETKNEKSVF